MDGATRSDLRESLTLLVAQVAAQEQLEVEGHYVVSPSVLGDYGETTLCFLYAALVRASASVALLRVAIRAQ